MLNHNPEPHLNTNYNISVEEAIDDASIETDELFEIRSENPENVDEAKSVDVDIHQTSTIESNITNVNDHSIAADGSILEKEQLHIPNSGLSENESDADSLENVEFEAPISPRRSLVPPTSLILTVALDDNIGVQSSIGKNKLQFLRLSWS